jgi:hypothetical protein
MKISFVFPVTHEKQENMFTHKLTMIAVPSGDVHFFGVTKQVQRDEKKGKDVVVDTPSALSLCGLSRFEIGTKQSKDGAYKETETRPSGVKVCPKCEELYKSSSHSDWNTFVNGKGIKV